MTTRLYSHLLGSPEDHVMSLNTIVTREPMMQYSIDILNSLCLTNGVRLSIAFTKPDPLFNRFFEQYFVSLLPNVIRYKMYCGFIPFVVTQHPVTGDKIPMLLPIGSYSWHIRTKQQFTKNENGKRSMGKRKRANSYFQGGTQQGNGGENESNVNLDYSCASEYVVECNSDIGVPSGDINVINLLDPMLLSGHTPGGSKDSCLGQAQYSPLYVSLQKYLALDVAQQRRCYADDWNTTARLFTTKTPPNVQNERAGRDEIPYGTTRFQQAPNINPKH
jgi:hypothetical protein